MVAEGKLKARRPRYGLTGRSCSILPPSSFGLVAVLHEVFEPLPRGVVDDVLVVGEVRVAAGGAADAVAAVVAGGRRGQAVGDLRVLFRLAERDAGDGHEARPLAAGARVAAARAGGVAEVDAVAEPPGVGP